MTQTNYRFPTAEKLKSRKQIALLFNAGRRFSQAPYQVIYLVEKGEAELLAGFGVSSRNFKKAVDRNRIKRTGREAYRLANGMLKEKVKASGVRLSLFLNYTGRELPDFHLVKEKMENILKKLEKECS
jgi:ribonuclease P protein component